MIFFRRALTGLFLMALTIGLLAVAGQTIRGAIQTRAAESGPSTLCGMPLGAAAMSSLRSASLPIGSLSIPLRRAASPCN